MSALCHSADMPSAGINASTFARCPLADMEDSVGGRLFFVPYLDIRRTIQQSHVCNPFANLSAEGLYARFGKRAWRCPIAWQRMESLAVEAVFGEPVSVGPISLFHGKIQGNPVGSAWSQAALRLYVYDFAMNLDQFPGRRNREFCL
jgi:hypothetical protein